ncbi:MAG: TetR/AcrR family transcriptional regulator [Pseudonocardia sp.]
MVARSTAPRGRTTASEKILDAAAALFITHGYAATTIEQIASEAGVAVPTVYFSFRNKMNILRSLCDRLLTPDAEPLADHRAALERALAEPDPSEQLAEHVRAATLRNGRTGQLGAMLRRAVDVDAAAAELWRADLAQRRETHRRLVSSLRARGALAKGVRPQRAVDTLTALLGPDLYCVLVIDRSWSMREWQRWTTGTLHHDLFAGTPSRE